MVPTWTGKQVGDAMRQIDQVWFLVKSENFLDFQLVFVRLDCFFFCAFGLCVGSSTYHSLLASSFHLSRDTVNYLTTETFTLHSFRP